VPEKYRFQENTLDKGQEQLKIKGQN